LVGITFIRIFVISFKLNNMREKIFINGYEYWMDRGKNPIMFYDSETATNGISIEYVHWTKDEIRQINEYLKNN